MFQDDLRRHILDEALSPLERMLDRFRLDLRAGRRFAMFRHLGGPAHFEVALFTDAPQQFLTFFRDDKLVHGLEPFERVFAVEDSRLMNTPIFGEEDAPSKATVDRRTAHQYRELES